MSIPERSGAKTALHVPTSATTSQTAPWHLPSTAAFAGAVLSFGAITFAAGAPSPLFVLFQQEWHFPTWLLTIAFAIYAITLLATLLVAGSLSDHIGRRPVLISAMVVETLSMALFVFAPNIGWIIAARAIQGIATGAATSAFTAAIVELAPERHKRLGALISSTAPIGGLALGALITGAAIQFTHDPSVIIFSVLAVVFILGTILVIFTTETVSRRPGAIDSLVPRLFVPRIARREFSASIPMLISTWMLAGLFLGLTPSIIRGVFHVNSGLVNGALVALPPAAGAITGLVFGRVSARNATIFGGAATFVGATIFVIGVTAGWFPLLFIGAIIGGVGFGTAFSGILRIFAPLATSYQRAELFAAVYLVSYLAYGVPALVAGELIGVIGLLHTVIGYGVAIIVATAIGLLAQLRLAHSLAPHITPAFEKDNA
jgi:MFS family permease